MSLEQAPADATAACLEAAATPSTRSDFGWALGAVFRRYVRAMTVATADMPGGPRGYEVLMTAAKDCPPTQLRLAQQLGIDKTVMTYLIDDLEKAGLVSRRPDPSDRRARQIVVTDAGKTRLVGLEKALGAAERHVLAGISSEDRATLHALLLRVAASAESDADEGMPDLGPTTCAEVEELAGL
jgi:DNA-binding MarR family transcriptional regulator